MSDREQCSIFVEGTKIDIAWNTRAPQTLAELQAAAKLLGMAEKAALSAELRGQINRTSLGEWGEANGVPAEAIDEFLYMGLSNIDFFTGGFYETAMLSAGEGE